MDRIAISILAIRNNEVLLVKKKEVWILPGGKPAEGESDVECLLRELSEELPLVKVSNIKYFKDFSGITPHKGDVLCAKVYYGDIEGDISPSAEINSAKWIKKEEIKEYVLSDITQKIIDTLEMEL